MKTPTLKTERLILRPISMDDVDDIQRLFAYWEIIQHLSAKVPWPYPNDGALTHIRDDVLPQMQKGEIHVWSIRTKDNEFIGSINLRMTESNDGHRGFWLALPHHGKGYMSEAVASVNDFAFDTLGMKKLIVKNAKNNTASRRVKEKTGAVYLHDEELKHNNCATAEVWEITPESWRRVKASPSHSYE